MKWIQSLDNPLIKEIKKSRPSKRVKFFEGVNLINPLWIQIMFRLKESLLQNNL